MHAIGMGGLIGLFLVIMQQDTMLMTWPLSLVIFIDRHCLYIKNDRK